MSRNTCEKGGAWTVIATLISVSDGGCFWVLGGVGGRGVDGGSWGWVRDLRYDDGSFFSDDGEGFEGDEDVSGF